MKTTTLLAGVIVGAGLMYYLDPERGRSRRARLRDQAGRTARDTGDKVEGKLEDLGNRAEGMAHEARSRFKSGSEGESRDGVSDATLEARVRSEIGHEISHPGAIEVTARGGRVTLSGPILADEVDRLIARVALVSGVSDVVNRLEVHQDAGNISSLQGSGRRS